MYTPVEEIKSRLDIAEFIQGYLKLQKTGLNYKAPCPFHGEKTPSFFVSPARQIWHCFGCGRGGDIFKFVMELEALDFAEALKMLAQKAGVKLRREDPAAYSEKNRLYDICESATLVFQNSLTASPSVKNYLQKRGVSENSQKEFRLGFAPQSWDFLLRALTAKGFKKEEIEKAGLAIKSEDKGSHYDRFRSRIMFPIADANGRVAGFSGRIFEESGTRPTSAKAPDGQAKYVNTPATSIYDKSGILYGFHLAKQDIRAKNEVVVVEGQMDCLMSQQAGVKNTIAVSGTALTGQQLKILRRLCGTIVSSFDTDAAGDSATKRSLALASQFEFERRIAVIPSGKDPADTVLENPPAWVSAVTQAKPVVEYFFEKTFREKNSNHINGKKEISSILLPYIAEITNEIERSYWVREISRRLEVGEESVWRELGKGSKAGFAYLEPRNSPEIQKIPLRRDLMEERLLILMPLVPPEVRDRELEGHHLIFSSATNSEIFTILKNGIPHLTFTPDIQAQLEMLKFKGEVLSGITQNLEEDFKACKKELERASIKEELARLGRYIEIKEKTGTQV